MRRFILTICFALSLALCFGQQNATWAKWSWLIGDWKGEGDGAPGKGSGVFSFKPDLNEKILIRKAHSVYPATNNRPETIHDDLLIVSLDPTGNATHAIYFDNEGHTINYSISYSDNSISLVSDKLPNMPIFRLTYTSIDKATVNTKFEMSQNGIDFMTYVEGKSKKLK